MPKTYYISPQEAEQIRERMKTEKNVATYNRMLAVALRGEGMTNKQVAEVTQYHEKRVSQLVSLFKNEGIEALQDSRKGGNNRLLSVEQEEEFLEQYKERAESGQIITVAEMKVAYDELTGIESSIPTIYLMMKRHGWRKVMPRSKHPNKASDEDIEASKKLTQPLKMKWKNIQI